MKRLMIALAVVLGSALSAFTGVVHTPVAHAMTSGNVAYVYDEPFNSYGFCAAENPAAQGINDTRGPGCGASIFVNALTGSPPPGGVYNGATFVNVPVPTVDSLGSAAFAGFDTVVLYEVCDIASHPTLVSAINSFINSGGKLMIFDADRCASGVPNGGVANYGGFQFPFSTNSPGPAGAGGSYTFVESNTLTTGLAPGPVPFDAVGDANIFTTFNGSWCKSIAATNVNGANGIVEGYAITPAAGLAIYEGEDFWFTDGPSPHLKQVFDNMLAQTFNPVSGLPCGAVASGITLRPLTASNPSGTSHTVTATVSDTSGNPSANVNVTFNVTSGPNAGATGSAATDASGQASFTYADTGGVGTDTITASFTDVQGNVHTSNKVTKTWFDQTISAQGTSFTATEGAPVTATVATFTDPDPNSTAGEYSATIDWGDSSTSAGTISGPTGGPFNVSGTHTYAEEGTYTVTVTITDNDNSGNSATVTSTATVSDPSVAPKGGYTVNAVEGSTSASQTVATFTDPAGAEALANYSASVDWGDGSTSAGTITYDPGTNTFTVSGSHLYAEDGTYPIKVTIHHDQATDVTVTSTANVTDAALSAAAACPANSLQAYNGLTATFKDAASPFGTLSDFSATIDWGDGSTSAGVVAGPNGGPYTVSGSHTYTTTGFFTITTNIKDVGGSTASASCKNVLIFAFAPGGGSFVIGDKNSAAGTNVTFWGAQWAKLNSLSGGGAPNAFKGFAESPKAPTCGATWNTDPGNSTPPPAGPLPAYMGVIVSSSISKSGSTISGDTPHIVIVKTNPGYAPNPGHAGTGTVVQQFC